AGGLLQSILVGEVSRAGAPPRRGGPPTSSAERLPPLRPVAPVHAWPFRGRRTPHHRDRRSTERFALPRSREPDATARGTNARSAWIVEQSEHGLESVCRVLFIGQLGPQLSQLFFRQLNRPLVLRGDVARHVPDHVRRSVARSSVVGRADGRSSRRTYGFNGSSVFA